MTCKCGHPHDNWTGEGEEMLCQLCWEKHCAIAFWSDYNARRLLELAKLFALNPRLIT